MPESTWLVRHGGSIEPLGAWYGMLNMHAHCMLCAVYQGLWRGLPVAIKTLLFSSNNSTGGMSSYEAAVNEAAMCLRLSHRNLVATYQ